MSPSFTLLFQVSLAAVASLLGFGAFGIFFVVFHDYNTGVWCFVTGIFAMSVVHLNLLFLRNKLDEWYDPGALENLKVLSLVTFSASLVASGVYISLAIRKHQELVVESYFTASAASCSTLFFGLWMFYTSRRFKRYVELCSPVDLARNQRNGHRVRLIEAD